MKLKYLDEQRAENQNKIQAILDEAKSEKRALSEEEISKFNRLKKLIGDIDATINADEETREMDIKEKKEVLQVRVSEITVKNLVEYLKIDYSSLLEGEITEVAVFLQTAISFIQSYTGLTLDEIDKHEDFVIAVYALVQDMYDNLSYYVDKNNLNKVVETILGMHSVNFL